MGPELQSFGSDSENTGEEAILREELRQIDVSGEGRELGVDIGNLLPGIVS